MPDHLFVYGTLKSSFKNEISNLLAANAKFIAKACINGRLYEIAGYPGLVLSKDPVDLVHGEVYSGIGADLLSQLDAYEGYYPQNESGSEYIRKTITVAYEGKVYECHVYIYNWDIDPSKRLHSGKY